MAKKKFESYSYHEVLDRCSIIEVNISDFIYKHPLVKSNKQMKKLALKAMENLAELYQLVGQVDYDKVDKEYNK
jgi:hypothetical protein